MNSGNQTTSPIFLGVGDVTVFQRVAAKGMDFVTAAILFVIGQWAFSLLGGVLAALYIGLADGLSHGESFGKRVFGLRTVEKGTTVGCGYNASLIRNLPFALFFLSSYLPLLWGLVGLINAVLIAFEVYLLLQLRSGVRLGDVLAGTEVAKSADGPR